MTLAKESAKNSKDTKGMNGNSVKGDDAQFGEGNNPQDEIQESQQNMDIRLPPLTVLYERKPFLYYNEIVKLGDEPITFQSIRDRWIYNHILLAENEMRIIERAKLKYEKWWRKRGRELSENAQKAYERFWYDRAYIETLSRYVCDAFGFTGDRRLTVLRFMLHLYQRLKKESVSRWTAIAEEELKIWERKPNTDPKAIRAGAHIILKFMSARGGVKV